MTEDTHSVLVVTKDSKLSQSISVMLIPPLFETEVLSDFNEARRRVAERSYNIILVDYSEGEGADFATDVSEGLATILLLTPPSLFEEVSYRVEGYGIIAITNPFDQFYFYNMIKAAIAVQYKVQVLSEGLKPEGINYQFVKGDIADKTMIDALFEQYHFDIVVNLAAQAGVRYSIENPDAYIMSNMMGFYNILEACRHSCDAVKGTQSKDKGQDALDLRPQTSDYKGLVCLLEPEE